ncbi:MAG TPA: GNAT family N-acetyltransferase [Bryobacteraceae bacterium]|nr:GNAT family N-acetyltransferase [Bryobacteraceae bacterium]
MGWNEFRVRRATEADAGAIVEVLEGIVSERVYSAIERPWPVEEQRRYLVSLSPREAFHVAETDEGTVVGYQSLDLYSPILHSMAHVAQLGTFLRPDARRRGVGQTLFQASVRFARVHGFSKIVIQVRASNAGAQAFYGRLGFRECGRLSRQVRVDQYEDDEIIMELFL